jgi:hypothetical protein
MPPSASVFGDAAMGGEVVTRQLPLGHVVLPRATGGANAPDGTGEDRF